MSPKKLMTRSEAKMPAWERGANPEQLEVIRHEEGPCRVLAAAGSGKTFAVVRNIARIVNLGLVPGSRILAMTFSTKAAGEMNKRTKDLGVRDARVGTWHSLTAQILREDKVTNDRGDILTSFEVDDTNRAKGVLKEVLGYKGMDWKGADLSVVSSFIARCKANLLEPGAPETLAFAGTIFGSFQAQLATKAFHLYNEALADKGLLPFDDMMVHAITYLQNDENARAAWAARWDRVICDEVQDNNVAQTTLATLLSKDHGNYMVVGDCFQAIYGFRGSSPDYLATFDRHWPNAKTILLPSNYRSGKKIIEVANGIVRPAKIEGLTPTAMVAMREDEGTVVILNPEDLDDEANEVTTRIVEHTKMGGSLADHTVLYRTNAQSRAIEESLLNKRVPYVVVGGTSFYERKEVKNLLSYLRLAGGRGKLDDIKRSINTPFRFLGAKFVERVTDEVGSDVDSVQDWPAVIQKVANGERLQGRQRVSANEWADMLRSMQKAMADGLKPNATETEVKAARPSSVLEEVVKQTRYIDYINREEGSESPENSGASNVREMVRVAERFPTADELLDYIDDTIRKARQQRDDKQAGGERVLLMSIHRSKGLEWPHVYVIGMNEMVLPHVASMKKGEKEIEEERRLAYVAATRARDVLTFSYVQRIATRAGIKESEPSRFLLDTGLPLNDGFDTTVVGAEKHHPIEDVVDVATTSVFP